MDCRIMKSPTIQILSTSFMILQSAGLWEPLQYSSLWTRLLYKLYSFIVLSSFVVHIASTTIAAILAKRSLFEIANNGFRIISVIVNFVKILNLRIRRDRIINIIETLEQAPCLPTDPEETSIQREHNRTVQNVVIKFSILVYMAIFINLSNVVQVDIPARRLPRKAWFPFDYSHGLMYWFPCFFQAIVASYVYLVTLGHDTLIGGMFLEVSAKLSILQHRFTHLHETLNRKLIECNDRPKNISNVERNLITDYVTFHLCILDLAERINSTFSMVTFLQYFFGTTMLCFSIYIISMMNLKSRAILYLLLYLLVIAYDIFIFCACASDITINSEKLIDSVFATNWIDFERPMLRSLMIIGCRSSRPIVLTVGYFLTLSLDSFKNLMKVSYSAYNALKSLH